MNTHIGTPRDIESPYAWTRLAVSLLLMTIGGSGMYSVAVVLPRIQTEFAVARGDASLPYTLTMIGFGIGGILMGRLSDRFGVMVALLVGTLGLGAGFVAAGAGRPPQAAASSAGRIRRCRCRWAASRPTR